MPTWKFRKVKNEPLNRDGETIAEELTEADFVGLADDGNGGTEIVAADAASGSAQPAIGVLMEEVRDPTNVNISGFENADTLQRQMRGDMRAGEYTFVGDEATWFGHGIFIEDEDGNADLTVNEPVYLDTGGGITQSKPTGGGDIVQVVGVAVDSTTFYLDVDYEYSTV